MMHTCVCSFLPLNRRYISVIWSHFG